MIEGVVNASLEATLVLTLSGPTGRTLEIEAVVDTGFSEFLMLPTDMTIDLGLEHVDVNEMVLADGSVETFDVFDVAVVWDGQSRCIDVHAAQGSPLVGMGLLHGHRLSVDVVEGGRVLVEPR